MSKIKVRLVKRGVTNVKLKPKNGIKVKDDTTYLYDPTLIADFVDLAEDWATKTDGKVEEDGEQIDYSSKAYAIGGTGTETNNAKYYAEQASDSATSASNSATTATTQAGIATTQAGIATTKAGQAATSEYNAEQYSISAGSSATNASNSASNAYSSEVNAASSASTATSQAGIATTQAGLASGYATSASGSASSASTSATNSQTWAEGTDAQVSGLGGVHSSKGWADVAKYWAESIGTVLHYKGSVATYDDLPTSGNVIGDVWNVLEDGSNYAWDGTGWDSFGSVVDLSPYRTSADQDIIDSGKVPTTRTVNGKALSSDISLTYSDVGAQQAGNYVTTNTVQTITEAKTFTKAVHFTGTGDTNAVFLTENTRFDIEGTTRTILGMGSAQFYINHSAYALLLRGKNARPSYNSATSYLALLSDLDGYVPTTRTVNGKALSSNISLTASDVGALPDSTVIPTVNDSTITITQGGVTKGSFTLNQSTDGTIALDAGGGGGSYTAGTGIDITNDVISVTSPTLVNLATNSEAVAIGGESRDSYTYSGSYGVAIGYGAVSGDDTVSIGHEALCSAEDSVCIGYGSSMSETVTYSVAIGYGASVWDDDELGIENAIAIDGTARASNAIAIGGVASANNSIQIGEGSNSEANSFYVGTARNKNWKMLGSNGKIPDARLNTPIPSQTGNSGKYLTTNGTNVSWATVSQMTATYDSVNERITFA